MFPLYVLLTMILLASPAFADSERDRLIADALASMDISEPIASNDVMSQDLAEPQLEGPAEVQPEPQSEAQFEAELDYQPEDRPELVDYEPQLEKNMDARPVTMDTPIPEGGPLSLETSFDTSYRRDKLTWNIGCGDGACPNILSELTWRDIQIFEVQNRGDLLLNNQFIFDWRGSYGWVYKGENQDSDFDADDRNLEFSRSISKSDIGRVYDLQAGIGYRFDLTPHLSREEKQSVYRDEWGTLDNWYLDALAGYGYDYQKFYMTDGVRAPNNTPIIGLKSHYQAEWKGPWIGAQMQGIKNRIRGMARFEYHWVTDYRANANWNLRTDFEHPKSYSHYADGGYGLVGMAAVDYYIKPWWSVGIVGKWQYWRVEDGVDRVYSVAFGPVDSTLNESVWKSSSVGLSNTFHF